MNELKEFEGILLIDKPKGITSHDVVDRARRKYKIKRIGHAGTLDPMATGLLILLVGKATKLSQYLMSLDKVYSGTITLGESTNTYDADGEVAFNKPVPELTLSQVQDYLNNFLGDQYQTPPMYSAIKIKGQPLYKLARKGQEVEREPRFIRVSKFHATDYKSPNIEFTMACTKGTYVRSIAHDLGEKIECGAHLSALRRDASDKFSVKDAIPLEELEALSSSELASVLIPGHQATPTSLI